MALQKTKTEEHHEKLNEKIQEFKNQFNVRTDQTGHEMTAEENGGIHSEEYWIKDLIESPADGLNFKIGGWFEIDTRGEEDTIYCHFKVEMNGENIGEDHQALKCRYHNDKEKWGELRWGSL